MELIRSPLNYTGNKHRIISQIVPHFPKTKKGAMLDLFCGGGSVGINSGFDKVIFIDHNEKLINLINFLVNSNSQSILDSLNHYTRLFGLSNTAKFGYEHYHKYRNKDKYNDGLKQFNSIGYYQLRNEYNTLTNKNTIKANTYLYLLMLYSFNNDIRFNSKGEFNLPVGKTDLNLINVKKLLNFKKAIENRDFSFVVGDFRKDMINSVLEKVDFVYLDPPYLITEAFYNISSQWNQNTELLLINFLDHLISINKNFVLSNVLSKAGFENKILIDWCENQKENIEIIDIDYHYKSSSYNKKNRELNEREVIIKYVKNK